MTPAQLGKIMPNASKEVIAIYADIFAELFPKYGLNRGERQAAFLGQIAQESGELRYTKEIWGPTAAQRRYEKRTDLGNMYDGDGKRFCGRGLIQITGRANYAACSLALTGNPATFLEQPHLLETPHYAAESALWFWESRGLNELADEGNYEKITKRINGGLTHYKNRQKYFEKAKKILSSV